jgi:hypothetical protein
MARPKKATVDYFPHMTEHGSTLFILQSRWGNDGYAAWFKLLERLGATDGLYLDCRHAGTWRHLQAYTGVVESVLVEILDTLAELGKIDASLWSNKVVYCQRLVDGVVDAFRRRKESIPTRAAVFLICGLAPKEFLTEETPLKEQKDAEPEVNAVTSTEREREREREIKTLSAFEEERRQFFEDLWGVYPKDGRVKKKEASRHYLATVKTDEDIDRINRALRSYINHLAANEWKKPQNGSTWFNNWQDWEDQDAK